jgi:hypothetical protein
MSKPTEGMKMHNLHKYNEIKEHFTDWMNEQDHEWLRNNKGEWHHECFNTDYYIIGTYKAEQWMGSKAFDIIRTVKEYEEDNFGEVTTDLADPEKVVNMYAYIVGEQVVSEWQ